MVGVPAPENPALTRPESEFLGHSRGCTGTGHFHEKCVAAQDTLAAPLQLTLPRAPAQRYGIRFGDRVRFRGDGGTHWFFSCFDARPWACAEVQGIEDLLSKDFPDGRPWGTVTIRNPFAVPPGP